MAFVQYTPAQRARRQQLACELHRKGWSLRRIGRKLGCSYSTVQEDLGTRTVYNARRRVRNCSPEGLRKNNERRARA